MLPSVQQTTSPYTHTPPPLTHTHIHTLHTPNSAPYAAAVMQWQQSIRSERNKAADSCGRIDSAYFTFWAVKQKWQNASACGQQIRYAHLIVFLTDEANSAYRWNLQVTKAFMVASVGPKFLVYSPPSSDNNSALMHWKQLQSSFSYLIGLPHCRLFYGLGHKEWAHTVVLACWYSTSTHHTNPTPLLSGTLCTNTASDRSPQTPLSTTRALCSPLTEQGCI